MLSYFISFFPPIVFSKDTEEEGVGGKCSSKQAAHLTNIDGSKKPKKTFLDLTRAKLCIAPAESE